MVVKEKEICKRHGGVHFSAKKESGRIVNSPSVAMSELLDNSLDACASRGVISYDKDRHILIVVDNGEGISEEDIQKAMMMWYPNDRSSNFGKFGIGMKSSLWSNADVFSILTKTKNKKIRKYTNSSKTKDFDYIEDFITEEDEELWEEHMEDKKCGTILISSSLKENINWDSFINHSLANDLGLTYYHYLPSKYRNGDVSKFSLKLIDKFKNKTIEVLGKDPLERHLEGARSRRYHRSFSYKDGKCKVDIVFLDVDKIDKQKLHLKIGSRYQGIYFCIKGRVIVRCPFSFLISDSGFHPTLNQFRAVVEMENLRDCYNLDPLKSSIIWMEEGLKNELHNEIMPFINKIKNSNDVKIYEPKEDIFKRIFKDAEKQINKKLEDLHAIYPVDIDEKGDICFKKIDSVLLNLVYSTSGKDFITHSFERGKISLNFHSSNKWIQSHIVGPVKEHKKNNKQLEESLKTELMSIFIFISSYLKKIDAHSVKEESFKSEIDDYFDLISKNLDILSLKKVVD